MEHALFVGDLGDRLGDARIHVADQEACLLALDQLARLLHAGADVIGAILDQQLDLAPENAALGVISSTASMAPITSFCATAA